MKKKLKVFDLFSGTGSSTQAFKDAGHTVLHFDLDVTFCAIEHIDIAMTNASYMREHYGQPDFIWASPPCNCFSVASIGRHWYRDYTPKTKNAENSVILVEKTIKLIKDLNPSHGWVIENPRGMLRKLPIMQGLTRHTVTYCQYGDSRMKPTDLWCDLPNWKPRPMCSYGDSCHESAPRGSHTGTQGMKNAIHKGRVPYELGKEIMESL